LSVIPTTIYNLPASCFHFLIPIWFLLVAEAAERLELALASVLRHQSIMEGVGFGELNW